MIFLFEEINPSDDFLTISVSLEYQSDIILHDEGSDGNESKPRWIRPF